MAADVVYLDHHATTPVDARVVEEMLPYFTEKYGNPGSVSHAYGWEAKDAVDAARTSIAKSLGARANEIVFTSGATEGNNLAIRGVAERARRAGDHLVTVSTEHKAVLDPIERLTRRGFEATYLDVRPVGDRHAGLIEPGQVAAALRDDTLLVSVMMANNEVGAIQPIAEIGAICKDRGVLFHCDATQAVGRLPVDVESLGVDLLSFSGHKIYGPKGVGGLYVRRRKPHVRLECQLAGGGHELGLRSGTLNVPGIVGLAKAVELCLAEMSSEAARQAALRDRLFAELCDCTAGVTLNGPALDAANARLPNNLNVSFAGVDGEALLMSVGDVAVSTGAACTSANPEPSHVLRAMGLGDDLTRGSLRFGLGRGTTDDDIRRAVSSIADAVSRLRKLGAYS